MTKQTDNRSLAEKLFAVPLAELTPTQETAVNLYELGLNVFPVPYGKKGGWAWRKLQYVRLNPEDIYSLFQGRTNLAVMTGRTSGNLFVIDCETEKSFRTHERRLKKAGIPIWAIRTGNRAGGGGHFYLQLSEGEVKGIKAGDYEVRGNRCYVLAPPSLHPDGRLYQWHEREQIEPPTVTLGQITWLPLQLAKKSPPASYDASLKALSQETRDFLFMGAPEGERNNRLFKAACDLAGNNFGYEAGMNLLFSVAIQSGLLEKETFDTINSAYSRPRTPTRPINSRPTIPQWRLAQQWTDNNQWKGRKGQTDRVVFLACCERAKTANEKGLFRAASREIANMAGITRTTASKSLRRLVEQKILVWGGKDHASQANLYRLAHKVVKNSRYDDTVPLPLLGIDSVTLTGKTPRLITHDVAERQALGKTAYHLYGLMVELQSPMRAKPLSVLAKLSVKQVYRALGKLRQYKLVEKVKGGFQAIPYSDDDLSENVAKPAGTYGKAERRKKQYERERAKLAAAELYRARFGSGVNPTVVKLPVKKFICPNCGQLWAMGNLEPPDICDYCGDLTTWQEISDTQTIPSKLMSPIKKK